MQSRRSRREVGFMAGVLESFEGSDRGVELQSLAFDLFCRLAEMSPGLERTWKPVLLGLRREESDPSRSFSLI